jgi:hypothetical protein
LRVFLSTLRPFILHLCYSGSHHLLSCLSQAANSHNMGSRSSSDLNLHDEDKLLSSSSPYGTHFTSYNSRTHRLRSRFLNWRNISVILSSLLLLTGISVWLHVILLVKNMHCETTPEEEKFEPDCQLLPIVIYLLILTFQ